MDEGLGALGDIFLYPPSEKLEGAPFCHESAPYCLEVEGGGLGRD